MGRNGFFVDPWGDVMPCNGMDEKRSMGNLKTQSWDGIWNSERAREVRRMVKGCKKNCWMIGSAAPAMMQNLKVPVLWIVKNKMRVMFGKGVV